MNIKYQDLISNVCVTFDIRSESFNRKFNLNSFVYNLMIGISKMNGENFLERAIEQRKKGTWIKI